MRNFFKNVFWLADNSPAFSVTCLLSSVVRTFRFGRKLAVIRGEVEREIQALVSKRDNVHTHHPYRAWDPVPSLSAASAGTRPSLSLNLISNHFFKRLDIMIKICFSRDADQPWEAAASDQHREGVGQHGLQTGAGKRSMMKMMGWSNNTRTKRLSKSLCYIWLICHQVSIHSVWLGNNITPLREEEWGEDEEDEADTPAPASPPISPINSRSDNTQMITSFS